MADVAIDLDLGSMKDYELFLRIKSLPRFRFVGRQAIVPSEYAQQLDLEYTETAKGKKYAPSPFLFDYQKAIAKLAIKKKKFAVFANCGLGKTNILLEYAKHVSTVLPKDKSILIVSPLMVIKQTIQEHKRFYPDQPPLRQVRANELAKWVCNPDARIGIANYEAITDEIDQGNIGSLIIDESSSLKSSYGKWGQRLIEIGKGLDWKLCLTGTPAPNDRIEYGNHAVFLDQFPTLNAFLAKYFVNRGQTSNRWELKHHALTPFYRSLSHWSIFLSRPEVYGWKDNVATIPPIHVHIHDVPLTDDQRSLVSQAGGDMFGTPGGITSRAKLSQLAKGRYKGQEVETSKPRYIKDLIATWPKESTIVWCQFNAEQEALAKLLPNNVSVDGSSSEEERQQMIEDFQSGKAKILITKGKVLGFGLNLQIATRQVFSGLSDSFETFHQCVKRSNRVGSSLPLNVHIPITPVERAMVDNVLHKAVRVQQDTEEQERLFKEMYYGIE